MPLQSSSRSGDDSPGGVRRAATATRRLVACNLLACLLGENWPNCAKAERGSTVLLRSISKQQSPAALLELTRDELLLRPKENQESQTFS